MCCGAIYWSGIRRVIYCCSEKILAKYAGDDFLCECRKTFEKGINKIVVEGPLLEEEGEPLHASFWPSLLNPTPISN